MATPREIAAQHIADAYGSPALYDTIYNNLQYASPGEIIWAQTANAASLRAAAAMPQDRVVGPDNTPINPFWYHGSIE